MAAWNHGKVVEHKQWNDRLHTLYIDAEIEPYKAGQFVKIGLEIDGEIIGRAHSPANTAGR